MAEPLAGETEVAAGGGEGRKLLSEEPPNEQDEGGCRSYPVPIPICDVEIEDDAHDTGDESYKDEQVDYFPGELIDSWPSFVSHGLYRCYKILINKTFHNQECFSELILVVKSDLGSDFLSSSFCLETDRGSVIVNLNYIGVVHLSREQLFMARKFQIGVLSILIHHNLVKLKDALSCLYKEEPFTAVTYLLLPSSGGKVDWHTVSSATFLMDRDIIQDISHKCSPNQVTCMVQTKYGAVCSCMVKGSVVYTPHSGHFYCITGIFDDLDGNSILKLRGGEALTYKKYYQTRHELSLIWENEPLLCGRHIFPVRNFLLSHSLKKEKEYSDAGVELPPELCEVIMTPLSVDTIYSFSFAPSIMHRIQCMLLAARLKKIHLDNCTQNAHVPVLKVLEAITTKKCQEEFSLESLETLGDSFLKYATSQHLFSKYKHYHEGFLSAKKESMVSNAALCRLACKRNFAGFIRTHEFDPKQWCIPGGSLNYSGNPFSTWENVYIRGTRYMKEKVIADSLEALIGAYLSTAGEFVALNFIKWLGMEIVFCTKMTVEKPVITRPETYVNVKDLGSLLNYSFNNPSLLVEALTHGSYQVPDIPKCYQRLEFLGDAVLDHLITVHLYNKHPGMSPGLLTDLRSASVNNDCYAHAAVKVGLNKHILHHASPELHKQMTFDLNSCEHSFSGPSYGWDAGTALPKVLGDVIESVAGAIYVDSGYNKETVWRSIRPLLEPLVTPETIEYHPVKELEELCSRRSFVKTFSKRFEDGVASITAAVEANGSTFTATRTGANKKTAKKLAAKALLEILKGSLSDL